MTTNDSKRDNEKHIPSVSIYILDKTNTNINM